MTQSVDDSIEYGSLAKIKIIGVGGCGVKSVQHMINSGLIRVPFVCADTELQTLNQSNASVKILLGENIAQSLGSNGDTEVGREAALESINDIRAAIGDAEMVFVVAGLGGGTGTGAASLVAQIAKEKEALTVGVVTTPLSSEGPERIRTAEAGFDNLKAIVDSLIYIPNDMTMTFPSMYYAVRCITDISMEPGLICIDFADVRTVLSESGLAFMGTGVASGKNRAREATQQALMPLIGNDCLKNARSILFSVNVDISITGDELNEIIELIRKAVSEDTIFIFGCPYDEDSACELRVTIIVPEKFTPRY